MSKFDDVVIEICFDKNGKLICPVNSDEYNKKVDEYKNSKINEAEEKKFYTYCQKLNETLKKKMTIKQIKNGCNGYVDDDEDEFYSSTQNPAK